MCEDMRVLNCRDNFVTGETNFKQDMESMRGKAEQQGTAQPGLRDAAKDIKKVSKLSSARMLLRILPSVWRMWEEQFYAAIHPSKVKATCCRHQGTF